MKIIINSLNYMTALCSGNLTNYSDISYFHSISLIIKRFRVHKHFVNYFQGNCSESRLTVSVFSFLP